MATDLSTTIATNAAAPKKVESDNHSVEAHPLTEQIEADRYLASKDAAAKPRRGLRFTKLIPPGAV